MKILLMTTVITSALVTSPIVTRAQQPVPAEVTSGLQPADPHAFDELLRRPVTVQLNRVSRRVVLDAIAASAKIQLYYKTEAAESAAPISFHVKAVPLGTALEQALSATSLVAVPLNATTVMIVERREDDASQSTRQTTGTITGQVIDSVSRKGMAQVTIAVLGTPLTAITNPEGGFTLSGIPLGTRTVSARILGFRMATRRVVVAADEPTVVTFSLTASPTVLSGVVTTATGVQRKLEVGVDIARIDVDSIRAHAPISSVTDLLETRVPGLTVLHTTGSPGDPARLRLRGASSIQGSNAPIVIVDGVRVYSPDGSENGTNRALSALIGATVQTARPSAIDQIDPNTIQTIEVMKGPSASALYGSDAANGVIVITTKKGEPGRTQWGVSANQGVTYLPGKYADNTFRFGHPSNITSSASPYVFCAPFDPVCVVDSVVTYQALNDENLSPFTHGTISGVSATVSGGTSALVYSVTGGTSNQTGTLELPSTYRKYYTTLTGTSPTSWMTRPDRYKEWTVSSQLTATLSPIAKVTLVNSVATSDQVKSSLGGSIIAYLGVAYVDTANPGAVAAIPDFTQRITGHTRTTQTAGTLAWQPRSWLPLTVTGGVSQSDITDKTYRPAGLPFQLRVDSAGLFGAGHGSRIVKTLNGGTSLPLPVRRGMKVEVAVGGNFVNQSEEQAEVATRGIPIGAEEPVDFLPASTANKQMSIETSTYGVYVEPRLALPGRVYINPALRLDGGSASGSNAGLTGFPKVNVSWVAIDGDGAIPTSWRRAINVVRLRSAIGVAGVQPGPAQRLRLLRSSASTVLGDAGATSGLYLNALGNTLLRPERSREFSMGGEADLFGNRLSVDLTSYYKKQLDAIVDIPVAPSVGGLLVSSQSVNIGAIRNRGLEFGAQVRIIDLPSTQWSFNTSIASNRNTVLSLGSATPSDPRLRVGPQVVAGYPIFGSWAKPLAAYADANHDGVIQRDEIVLRDSAQFVGASDPRYQATFGTNLSAFNNRVSFAATMNYQDGLTQFNQVGGMQRSLANAADATLLQQAIAVATGDAFIYPTNFYRYQTVNTLRLTSLSVNYRVSASVARLFRARSMSVALQGSNLYLRTNYQGKDPNVNASSSGDAVRDSGQLPQPRIWQLRVNLTN